MPRGYVKLWRESTESDDYFSEPFTRWQAWTDLLLLAQYKENVVMVRGIPITVKEGQVLAGEEFLADRWKWSRGKVRRYMAYLSSKTVQRIVQQKSHLITVISIVNWEKYQGDGTTNGTEDDTTDGTTNGQQTVQQTDIPKKDKERLRKTKNIYGEFQNVMLTLEERNKLDEKFGTSGAIALIENLSSGIASKGYKYKSHYATILSWERKNTKNGGKHGAQPISRNQATNREGPRPGHPDYRGGE